MKRKQYWLFDCPSCSVFMKFYNKKGEPPRFICPICKSIFLPSEKAIKDAQEKSGPHFK